MGNKNKKRGNSKVCFIPRTTAMSYSQYISQEKNIKKADKIQKEQIKRKVI